jgi:hypothetical protein
VECRRRRRAWMGDGSGMRDVRWISRASAGDRQLASASSSRRPDRIWPCSRALPTSCRQRKVLHRGGGAFLVSLPYSTMHMLSCLVSLLSHRPSQMKWWNIAICTLAHRVRSTFLTSTSHIHMTLYIKHHHGSQVRPGCRAISSGGDQIIHDREVNIPPRRSDEDDTIRQCNLQ